MLLTAVKAVPCALFIAVLWARESKAYNLQKGFLVKRRGPIVDDGKAVFVDGDSSSVTVSHDHQNG